MPANIDRLPFNVINRCPAEPEFADEIPQPAKGESPALVLIWLAGLILTFATGVGLIVLSRWAWHQPAQALVGLLVLACVAWGVERGCSE